jgi:hypothetical protein
MGVTDEGIAMSDESKKKVGLPGKKVIGFFYFEHSPMDGL